LYKQKNVKKTKCYNNNCCVWKYHKIKWYILYAFCRSTLISRVNRISFKYEKHIPTCDIAAVHYAFLHRTDNISMWTYVYIGVYILCIVRHKHDDLSNILYYVLNKIHQARSVYCTRTYIIIYSTSNRLR